MCFRFQQAKAWSSHLRYNARFLAIFNPKNHSAYQRQLATRLLILAIRLLQEYVFDFDQKLFQYNVIDENSCRQILRYGYEPLQSKPSAIHLRWSRGPTFKTKPKDSKKNLTPRPRNHLSRTEPIEAKAGMIKAKDQRHYFSCNYGRQIFFYF